MRYIPLSLVMLYFGFSLISFIAYKIDKAKAQRKAWRTSENTLHILALLGGWPGAAIAQNTLRHKTQKYGFIRVFWLTVFVNCSILAYLIIDN